MIMTQVTLIPILSDNYTYFLKAEDGTTAIVDPGDADPIITFLEEHEETLDLILNTHHHGDHVAGNGKLQDKYGARIAAPLKEAEKIGNVDFELSDKDVFAFGDEPVTILETPGHTLGHISFYFTKSKILFCGDTLFVMGCGRLFEGDAEMMWHSFQKIRDLPGETKIYCGHEYTLSNAEFCAQIEPDNNTIQSRLEEIRELRQKNQPTIPTSLESEKKTNLFLMAKTPEAFAEIRKLKDRS